MEIKSYQMATCLKIALSIFGFFFCLFLLKVWKSREETKMLTKKPSIKLPYFENGPLKTFLSFDTNNIREFHNQSEKFMEEISNKYGDIRASDITPVNTTLTPHEKRRMKICIMNGPRDRKKNGSKFWGDNEHIRRTHHDYLKRDGAVLIEVGGNKGDDAEEFVRLYNPQYIILEPLEGYADILKQRFHNNSKVKIINLGLGVKNEIVMVSAEGNNACATSKFSSTSATGNLMVPLYLMNATDFLSKIGVGFFDVDLITFNCEGCEFEALESILSSSLIRHFRNIQFATHSQLAGLPDAIQRYCRIQELLSRTHRPTYQYRLIWENWRRKDL